MPGGYAKLRESAVMRDALALAAISLLPLWQVAKGVGGPVELALNIGPNDAAYVTGFYPNYEIENGKELATRWSTHAAGIDLPFVLDGGPLELSYRVARVLPQTAVVEVSLDGRPVDRFTCRGGAYVVRRVRLPAVSPTPLHLDFTIDSHDRRDMGLKFDWVRLRAGRSARVLPSGWRRWLVALLVLFVFGLCRWLGFKSWGASAAVLPLTVAAFLWTQLDPFGVAHVAPKLVPAAAGLSLLAAWALRGERLRRWVVLVFLAGLLVKGAGLFHPRYWYIDIQNHRRYVNAFASASGSLVERGVTAQKRVHTAYPRHIGNKDYAFPYSPLPFVVFSWLPQEDELLDNAMNLAGLAAASLQVVVVYWLGRLAVGPAVGLWAAFLNALLPPLYSRLLLYMWPSLWAGLLDASAIVAALALGLRPESRRRTAALAALSLASFLSYISSLFTLSLFLAALALLTPRLRWRLLGILAGAAGLTVGLLYWSFTRVFFLEIVPALLKGAPTSAVGMGTGPSLSHALSRIPLFYGYVCPALALAGLEWMRRRASPAAFKTMVAYLLAFAALVALRGWGGGLFKDLKEILFAAPLVATLAAAALQGLSARSRLGRAAALVLSAWLAVVFMSRYRDELKSYAYPATAVLIDAETAQ